MFDVCKSAEKVLHRVGRATQKEWLQLIIQDDPRSVMKIFTKKIGFALSEQEREEIARAATVSERKKLYNKHIRTLALYTIDTRMASRLRERLNKLNPENPIWGGSMNGYTYNPTKADRLKYIKYHIARNKSSARQLDECINIISKTFKDKKYDEFISSLKTYAVRTAQERVMNEMHEHISRFV